jgi:hypothetical protein
MQDWQSCGEVIDIVMFYCAVDNTVHPPLDRNIKSFYTNYKHMPIITRVNPPCPGR